MLISSSNFIFPRECTSEVRRRTRSHDNMQTWEGGCARARNRLQAYKKCQPNLLKSLEKIHTPGLTSVSVYG